MTMATSSIRALLLFISFMICFDGLISFSNSFVVIPSTTTTRITKTTADSFSSTHRRQNTNTPSRILLQNSFLDNFLNKNDNNNNNASKRRPKVDRPKDFVQPEPKPLQISPSTDLIRFTKSAISFVLRLGTGTFVLGWKLDTLFYNENDNNDDDDGNKKPLLYSLNLGPFSVRDTSSVLNLNNNDDVPRPNIPLVLYEYDSSPYCKRVREMINLLDLTVEYRPCPGARDGKFSMELYEKTGRRTVPYLYDPNTDNGLFESNDQIEYLLQNYGPQDADSYDRKALWPITFEGFSIFTSTLCAILLDMPCKTKQVNARPDNEDMVPIEIWGNEASPFVRPVREKLCSLCLPHYMISCSRGSINRDIMIQKTGRFQVPYLVDPNTGIEMYESEEIVKYLDNVYTI
jgi:glutathione S-transferase